MLELDEQALNDAFWETELSYVDQYGVVTILTEDQKLLQNQPKANLDETQPWVRFKISPGATKMDSRTTPATYVQQGQAILEVFTPKGSGMSAARKLRSDFAEAFRDWRSADGRTYAHRISFYNVDHEAYTQINVTVSWESKRKPS